MIRPLAAFALFLSACAPVQADEGRFRADMIALLKKAYPDVGFAPGEEALTVSARGGGWEEERTINLHRIYHFCRTATAEDCGAIKEEFAANIGQTPDEPTAASLRIIVRDADYAGYFDALEAKAGKRLSVRRRIGEDLFALLASDGETTIASVGDETLADLGLSEEEAWSRAWRQTLVGLPIIPEPAKFREQAIAFEAEQYLASLTADLPTWRKISDAVGPDLFMTVVSDQFVFAGPMADGPGLEEFRKTVAEDCAAQPRCVSPNIYRFRNGRWVIAR